MFNRGIKVIGREKQTYRQTEKEKEKEREIEKEELAEVRMCKAVSRITNESLKTDS